MMRFTFFFEGGRGGGRGEFVENPWFPTKATYFIGSVNAQNKLFSGTQNNTLPRPLPKPRNPSKKKKKRCAGFFSCSYYFFLNLVCRDAKAILELGPHIISRFYFIFFCFLIFFFSRHSHYILMSFYILTSFSLHFSQHSQYISHCILRTFLTSFSGHFSLHSQNISHCILRTFLTSFSDHFSPHILTRKRKEEYEKQVVSCFTIFHVHFKLLY